MAVVSTVAMEEKYIFLRMGPFSRLEGDPTLSITGDSPAAEDAVTKVVFGKEDHQLKERQLSACL